MKVSPQKFLVLPNFSHLQAIDAIFDRYDGWATPPEAGGAALAEAERNAAAELGTGGLIDRAVGFKEALQELIKDQASVQEECVFQSL